MERGHYTDMTVGRAALRLLMATPLYPPRPGGAAGYFSTLVQRLAARPDIERIVVLTRASRGLPWRERRDKVVVLRLLPSVPGVASRPVRMMAAAAIHGFLLLTAWRWRVDLVHVHTMLSRRGLDVLARLGSPPIIADMRDLAARDEGVSVAPYARCAALICASENIAEFLRSRAVPAERLHHIVIPLELPRPRTAAELAALRRTLGVPADKPYVCFAGAVTTAKGVMELLDAFGAFAAAQPDFHLVLAGPGRPGEAARERVQRSEDARVHYVGPLPHEQMLAVLQDAALVVLPSRTEGLPRVCLEALALGRKVLCPPGVIELERACPEFVLPDLAPTTITAAMIRAVRSDAIPKYDLTPHDPDLVIERVRQVYVRVTGS
ncbi:MAG: hypothetical protein DMD91_13760 [Candidatus Rokuibacteriota bacterium]|nr:MAG: hypothetical protein DMD91_13760 [Candidatus Rokubacteria bacterium]